MDYIEILEIIESRMKANREKAKKVRKGTFVNIPEIYAQAYENLLLEIEDENEKRRFN